MMTAFQMLQAAAPRAQEEGLAWNEVLVQYVQFAGYFLAIGSIAYRYLILPRAEGGEEAGGARFDATHAATLGLVGALLLLLGALGNVELNALLHHKSFADSLPKSIGRFQFKIIALVVALAGFTIARRISPKGGWPLAALGTIGAALQPLVTSTRWSGRVNAIHVLAASTWLGTLAVMFFVAIRAAARASRTGTPRHLAVANVVNAFSPVALTAATIVALSGATAAWLKLKRLSNLWESDFGKALIVKLCLVATVVALGWWNWKRVRPTLSEGDESLARIQRSARAELAVAALVLLATAVLVSLPSPK